MDISKKIALSVCFILVLGFSGSTVNAQTFGTATPIPLNQILSGKTSSYSGSSSGVTPYTQSGGADYDVGLSTSDVMKNRARRDAFAQAKTGAAFDDMNQSYLDNEYQQAFQKYQAQFRRDGDSSSSAQLTRQNVRVKYKKDTKKLFVMPQRVFKGY